MECSRGLIASMSHQQAFFQWHFCIFLRSFLIGLFWQQSCCLEAWPTAVLCTEIQIDGVKLFFNTCIKPLAGELNSMKPAKGMLASCIYLTVPLIAVMVIVFKCTHKV